MDVVSVRLQVSRRDIVLLCSLVEGYEGVAVVHTVDSTQGLVELLVAPAFHTTALTLLEALAQEIHLHLIAAGDVSSLPGSAPGDKRYIE
jgi:hypothetical protein